MLLVGFVVVYAGYGLASWGYLVIKGQNVPFGAWMRPGRGVWDWSAGAAPPIPDTQVWPSSRVKQVTGKAEAV